MDTISNSCLIDDKIASFMECGVSIIVSGRNAENVPSLVRASGCRLSDHRQHISIFISMSHAGNLLMDLRQCGVIAVVFSKPSTHQSLQVKGNDARISPLNEGDWARICLYREALIQDITSLGYPSEFASTMLAVDREDMVSVTFSPYALFQQTPGPDAGKLIEATR